MIRKQIFNIFANEYLSANLPIGVENIVLTMAYAADNIEIKVIVKPSSLI
jgi:hypothetical protein